MSSKESKSIRMFRPALAGTLSLILMGQPVLGMAAQDASNSKSNSVPSSGNALLPIHSTHPALSKLSTDERILHFLNRVTFGPTPDEIAAIKKTGMDKWFDQQLHPQSISDAHLDARLAEFPALHLPVDQLLNRFPSGAEIRQVSNGKRPMPNDPELYAIYNRHVVMYEAKQAKKAEAQSSSQAAMDTKTMAANEANMRSAAVPPGKLETKREAGKDAQTTSVDPKRTAYSDVKMASLLALPPADRVDRILSMQPAEYDEFRSSLKPPLREKLVVDLSSEQKEMLLDFDNPTKAVIDELQAQRLLRDIYSQRQLLEVMTTFWMNHFNVYLHKNEETPYYLVSYERDVIRPRALGNFEDLLVATAVSPAMLIYLDNSSSTGPDSIAANKQKDRPMFGKAAKAAPPGLNENYARELMELHTLGVNGGYTQKDVTEVAKVFTGWTVDRPGQGGPFKYDESRHEPGKKLVLGKKIKENGPKEGLQVLHMLATSPATAHFISRELAIAFVSDNPPESLVDRMAQTFLKTHGDIPSILRTMFHGPEFWAPENYQIKVKTPLEYVVSAARASGADVTNTQPLINNLNQMGMPLYACIPPTGYAATADAWVSTGALVTRMNFSLSLANNKLQGIQTKWSPAVVINTPTAPNNDTGQVIDPTIEELRLETRLIPTGVSEKTRSAVLEQTQSTSVQATATQPSKISTASPVQVNPGPGNRVQVKAGGPSSVPNSTTQVTANERQDASLAGLLLGSPEFQRR